MKQTSPNISELRRHVEYLMFMAGISRSRYTEILHPMLEAKTGNKINKGSMIHAVNGIRNGRAYQTILEGLVLVLTDIITTKATTAVSKHTSVE